MKTGYRKIAVGDGRFLYDTTTNAVVPVTPAVYAMLEDYLRWGARGVRRRFANRFPAENLRQALDFLTACRESHMLKPMHRLDYLPFGRTANLRRYYAHGLKRMTLGITVQCNQRCLYCPNGGAKGKVRRFGNLSWETAKQAADFLLSHADHRSSPILDLYGGEPLLDWPLVRQIITYIRRDLRRRDVEVRLCTNALRLDPGNLKFLMANKIVLQISLDGPAPIHDRSRILADGRGTHTQILRLLKWIRRRNPVYYRKYVRPHCTFSIESDLLEVFRYFSRAMFRDLQISFGYRTGAFGVTRADRLRHEAQLDELTELYLRALREGRPFNRALFANIMDHTYGMLTMRIPGKAARDPQPNGVCIPGHQLLFVSGDGTLHPCYNCIQPGTEIGDCRRGIDLPKAQRLLKSYARLCNRMCQECWARRLCQLCFLHCLGDDGRLSRARKEKACRRERRDIIKALRRYIYVWQNEPSSASKVKDTLHYRMRHPAV
jgi:uncharacterized protein